jgi:hypothetical protein
MFMVSIFEILKGVIKKLDQYRSRFYWQGDTYKKKYRLAKWDILCRPKDQGGLGIIDPRDLKYLPSEQMDSKFAQYRRHLADFANE